METQLFTLKKNKREIHIYPKQNVDTSFLKKKIIELFNQKLYDIKVHNVPFCFLPEKIDNIIQYSGEHKEACNQCTLKPKCKGVSDEYKDIFEPRPIGSSPTELAIEVNRICAFKCDFCFYNDANAPEKKVLEKDKIFELIDEMVLKNIPVLRLFGGDPILHKNILEILSYARIKNRYVIINTNGIFKNEDMVKKVMYFADLIIISLQGFNENSEKVLTGRGDLFKPIVKSLYNLAKINPKKVLISTIISRYLLDNFDQFQKIIEATGVAQWGLNRPLFGKDTKYPWLKINKEEIIELAEKVKESNNKNNFSTHINNYPHCFFPEELRDTIKFNDSCNGVNRMFFDIDGFYKPTPGIEINLGDNISESWEKNPFKEIGKRDFVDKKCKECEMFMSCYGGSRTQAKNFNESYFAKDPYMI